MPLPNRLRNGSVAVFVSEVGHCLTSSAVSEPNPSRQRTPIGVHFYIAKKSIPALPSPNQAAVTSPTCKLLSCEFRRIFIKSFRLLPTRNKTNYHHHHHQQLKSGFRNKPQMEGIYYHLQKVTSFVVPFFLGAFFFRSCKEQRNLSNFYLATFNGTYT